MPTRRVYAGRLIGFQHKAVEDISGKVSSKGRMVKKRLVHHRREFLRRHHAPLFVDGAAIVVSEDVARFVAYAPSPLRTSALPADDLLFGMWVVPIEGLEYHSLDIN